MNIVRFEKAARRQADRLPARVTDLVDESSDILRHKLDEAVDLIQGAAAQLAEDGQSLLRAQMKHAAELAEQGRKQAKAASRVAVKAASSAADESYAGLKVFAGRNPLAVAAVAVGVGVIVGFILRPRRVAEAEPEETTTARAAKANSAAPARKAAAKARVRKPASTQASTTH